MELNKTSEDNKLICLLEIKIQRLIDELNKINKKASEGFDYKYLYNRYIWKYKILKNTEERLAKLFIKDQTNEKL